MNSKDFFIKHKLFRTYSVYITLCLVVLVLGIRLSSVQGESSKPGTKSQVDQLLKRARQQISHKKLTTPYRDNAYETLMQVKKLDPENPEIYSLLETIKAQYKEWIAVSEKRNQKAYARLFCFRYLLVDPKDAAVRRKLTILDRELSREHQVKQASVSIEDLRRNMVLIPGGTFEMGSDDNFPPDRTPRHRVYVAPFYMDKYEVTNGEYAAFLNDQGNPESAYIKLGADPYIRFEEGEFKVVKGKESLPVNFVSWYGAEAFCRWKGKRLPTEAEWEKAARGPTIKTYSWGDEPPSDDMGRFVDEIDWRKILQPVDQFPKGRSYYGLFNMSGSVWEWCSDWYDPLYYRSSPKKNPAGPSSGKHRVLRGGQAGSRTLFLEVSYRNHNVPILQSPYTGCRCAMDAEADEEKGF